MNRTTKLAIIFSFLVFLSSCVLDEDLDPISGDSRDKFLGTWLFSESPAARSTSFSVTISYDPSNSSQVLLKNMGNFGYSIAAYGVVTNNNIYIPSQEIYTGMTISGSGSMSSSDLMNWEYTITGGGDSEDFVAVATK